MVRHASVVLFVAAVLALSPLATRAQSSDDILLRTAQELEKVKGDVKGALEIYRKLLASPDSRVAASAREAAARLGGSSSTQVSNRPSVPAQLPDGFFAGTNTRPDFSPDGQAMAAGILIGSENRPSGAIVVRPTDGGPEQRVTAELGGVVRNPKYSPDGHRIAAVVETRPASGSTAASYALVVAPGSAGSGPVQTVPLATDAPDAESWVRANTFPAWSPDSKSMAAVSNIGGSRTVVLVDATTGQTSTVGSAGVEAADFQWSPDGRELAWRLAQADAPTMVVRILTLGTKTTRDIPLTGTANERMSLGPWTTRGISVITRGPAPMTPRVAQLNPSSGTLATTCTGHPFLTSAETGIALLGGAADLCGPFFPDGNRQIVWKHDVRRLFVRDVTTSTDRPLVDGFSEERGATIAPDGKTVLFASNRDAAWALYAFAPGAVAARPLLVWRLEDVPRQMAIHWTRAGAFVRVSYDEAQVLRVPMSPATGQATGDLSQLTQDSLFNLGPSVSPDGQRVVYFSKRNGVARPALMRADDGSQESVMQTQPVTMNYRDRLLWWSNREFVYRDVANPGVAGLEYVVVDVGTGARRSLGSAMGHAGPLAYSVDASRQEVVYALQAQTGGRLEFRGRSTASGPDRLVAVIEKPAALIRQFTVSPDGTRLAYLLSTQFVEEGRLSPPCEPCELGVIDLATGQVRRYSPPTAPQLPVAISPNNRFLLYGGAQPRIMNLETGESWRLLGNGAPQWNWYQDGSWAPDGSFVVFGAAPGGADVIRTEWRKLEIQGSVR